MALSVKHVLGKHGTRVPLPTPGKKQSMVVCRCSSIAGEAKTEDALS